MKSSANLIGFLFVLLVAGCGGGGDDDGTVYFKVDATTCSATRVAMNLYIDGAIVGTETLGGGQTSKGYSVAPGTHFLSARVVGIDYSWPPTTAEIPGGATFNFLLTCS